MELEYFRWLTDKYVTYKRRQYIWLLKNLWMKKFYAVLDQDNSRLKDGLYLRYIFCKESGRPLDDLDTVLGGARVLEVLIALVNRGYLGISFEKTGIGNVDFFYIILGNIGFDRDKFSDKGVGTMMTPNEEFDFLINRWLDRKYNRFGGDGGAFPLSQNCHKNAIILELWDQMSAYIYENGWI